MSTELVDISLVELDGQELQTVVSMSITKSDKATVVKTMNRRRRAIGKTRGVPDFSVELECVYEAANREVDWDKKKNDREIFTLTYEMNIDGKRRSLLYCEVDEITESFSSDGGMKASIKITALDDKADD